MRAISIRSSCQGYISICLAVLATIHEIGRRPLKQSRPHSFSLGLTRLDASEVNSQRAYTSGRSWPILAMDPVIVELRHGVFSRQVGESHTRHLSQILLDGDTVADCIDGSRSFNGD